MQAERITLHGERLEGAVHALGESIGPFAGQTEETLFDRLDDLTSRVARLEARS
jgi:hypothetical protein